jgi:hypothetical protein
MVLWTKFPTKGRDILDFLIYESGFTKDSINKPLVLRFSGASFRNGLQARIIYSLESPTLIFLYAENSATFPIFKPITYFGT